MTGTDATSATAWHGTWINATQNVLNSILSRDRFSARSFSPIGLLKDRQGAASESAQATRPTHSTTGPSRGSRSRNRGMMSCGVTAAEAVYTVGT